MANKQRKRSNRNLTRRDLVGHEKEKFTDLASAFRTQVGQLLAPGTGQVPQSLKRLDVSQLLGIKTFLEGKAAKFLDRDKILWVSYDILHRLIDEACSSDQAEALVIAERWRQDYAESGVESEVMQIPGWFNCISPQLS